jgi:hypothetical protein
MFSPTPLALLHKNYKARLKTRMVGYIPSFVPRKAKNCLVMMRSEANTAFGIGYLKPTAERLDTTGRKVTQVRFDPVIGRYCLFKEAKIKGVALSKAHIQKPAPLPWLTKPEGKAPAKA